MTQLIVTPRPGQNQYYAENLAEGILPLQMLLIPPGTFQMGSPDNDINRRDSEGPQHEVTISQFFMAKYPVTQAQWRVVAEMPQVNQTLKPESSHFKGDLRPVESVSWADAVEFCDRLTVKTHRQYRLPTEAEWEYACRAGTKTPFHFGDTITTELANYDGNNTYNNGPKGEFRQETTPVNQFDHANAFGLCDMHGNVWEWCQDHWHGNYEGAPTDGSAWLTDKEESMYVLRGGSWLDDPRNCRSASRHYISRAFFGYDLGLRVVCSAPRTLP